MEIVMLLLLIISTWIILTIFKVIGIVYRTIERLLRWLASKLEKRVK